MPHGNHSALLTRASYFCLGASISLVTAYVWYRVPLLLKLIEEKAALKEQPEDQPRPNEIHQNASNAISLEALEVLVNGPNQNLSCSALRFVVIKFLRSDNQQQFYRDLGSRNWQKRDYAIKLLKLLLTHQALDEHPVDHDFLDKTLRPIVESLVHLLPEHDQAISQLTHDVLTDSPVKPPGRPAHEKSLLWILQKILDKPRGHRSPSLSSPRTIQILLDAGIVKRWLAHYPFPVSLPQYADRNFQKSNVVDLLRHSAYYDEDAYMAKLVDRINVHPGSQGSRELVEAGLKPAPSSSESSLPSWAPSDSDSEPHLILSRPFSPALYSDDDRDEDNDVRMVNGDATAGITSRPSADVHTLEERLARRRHREAIVVAEAGAPIRPENILQRQPTEIDLSLAHVQEQQATLLTGNAALSRSDVNQVARERIDGIDDATPRLGPPAPPPEDWSPDGDLCCEADMALRRAVRLVHSGRHVPSGVVNEIKDITALLNDRRDKAGLVVEGKSSMEYVKDLIKICELIEEHDPGRGY